jgi:hypothetical protein
VALEQDERDEREHGDGEGGENPPGGPAVRVRLDQAVGEREEPDPGREEAGEVEPLLA